MSLDVICNRRTLFCVSRVEPLNGICFDNVRATTQHIDRLFRLEFADQRTDARMASRGLCVTLGTLFLFAALDSGITRPAARSGVKYPAALEQCGECHMIFPAQMLPQRSWTAILSRLDNHFGEVASIPAKELDEIRDFLTSNAADSANASPQDRHYMSEILSDSAPLRITRTPWWNQMHSDFNFEGVKHSDIRSPANCLACHKGGVR